MNAASPNGYGSNVSIRFVARRELNRRSFARRDPRQHGSGHTGGLNLYRLLLTGAGDIGKGALAAWLAGRLLCPEPAEGWEAPWAVPLAGAAAVAGHCWPAWLGFRGDMGVGTSGGAFLLVHPWTIPLAIVAFVVLRRIIPHSPRAMLATLVALPVLQMALGAPWTARALGVLVAGMMFVRYRGDWGQVYGKDSSVLMNIFNLFLTDSFLPFTTL